jgi:chromodomain-helicase-DNA-binding protein 4
LKVHIVIASYEVPIDKDSARLLKKIPWQGLIVDEGQRLKSEKTLLFTALSDLNIPFKILLTGEPRDMCLACVIL